MARENSSFDVIVVGAGAAGATLAARLAGQDLTRRILLVEAGGKGRGPLFSVPLMTGVLLRSTIANWGYVTEPQAHLAGRRLNWARGKALGGSTAINGMVYMRGLASDYEVWAQRGLAGWGWADIEPVFRALENAPDHGDGAMGDAGPVSISSGRRENPLFALWLEAARQAGHRLSTNFNGPDPEGIGTYDFTIRQGRRWSSARAFLDNAPENLTILTTSHVLRVAIERDCATGIVIAEEQRERLIPAGEVVLSAGTIGSPQLLMLSGIGPADDLRRHGIAVVADLPGVGQNLHDHVLIRVSHQSLTDETYDRYRRIDRAALAFLQAWGAGKGPAATFPIEVGGLLKSDPALDLPDIQCAFLPGLSSATVRLPFMGMAKNAINGQGFFANAFVMRPQSRGTIRLASPDPRAHPLIDPNCLAEPSDRLVLREAVRLLRDIFAQSALDGVRGPEITPGADITSDAALDDWISRSADTVYHPVGTCAMGPDHDSMAVLDARLKVRGIAGLRVADASVMPVITSSNTMAPSMMIGERCARFMQ